MTRAVAIVHVYPDQVFDERDPSDIREIVGILVQNPNEENTSFDQRVNATRARLSNVTFRERYADADPKSILLAAAYIDNKVYSGYLETETVDILD